MKVNKSKGVACVGGIKNAYRILVCNPVENRRFGRPKPTSENCIKMNLKEIGCESVDLI
jgi:hypothetical protein